MPLAKITAVKREVALSYHRVRGLYFLTVIFPATIIVIFIIILGDNFFRNISYLGFF